MPRPSRDKILAAAERVFGERGYGDTSLRELMAAAECSTTAFYARFSSKEAVLETLVRELLEDLYETAAQALPRTTGIDQGWDEGLRILVEALGGRRGTVRVLLTEASRVPGPRAVLRDAYAGLAALLSLQLKQAARRGAVDVPDAEALAWAIVGALSMQLTRWAVFEELDDEGLVGALRTTAGALLPRGRGRARDGLR
jgi:AcrR family transcriptional regulator